MPRREAMPPVPVPVAASVSVPVVVPARDASVTWLGAWVVGQFFALLVAGASGAESFADAGAGWLLATAVAGWVPLLVGVHLVTLRHAGTLGVSPARRIGLSFRPIDLWGIPAGVLVQIVALPALYWPLERLFPDTFALDDVERRARELYEGASGGFGAVLLVLVVVVGAPLVEEIVYRGLLQRSFIGRFGRWPGVAIVAIWFAVVHFQPVEIPGLLAIAVVLGVATALTDRLGAGILAHMAFNAAGLVLVARS